MERTFSYTVLGERVYGDPIAIHRRFTLATGGDPDALLQLVAPPEGQPETSTDILRRLDAEEQLARAARKAFQLPEYDTTTGQGATDDEALSLLWKWLEWMQKKSLTPAPTPTSPPPTAAVSSVFQKT
jgi:hypothetical protein